MKRYCARSGLLIGSMMMALAGNLVALIAARFTNIQNTLVRLK